LGERWGSSQKKNGGERGRGTQEKKTCQKRKTARSHEKWREGIKRHTIEMQKRKDLIMTQKKKNRILTAMISGKKA